MKLAIAQRLVSKRLRPIHNMQRSSRNLRSYHLRLNYDRRAIQSLPHIISAAPRYDLTHPQVQAQTRQFGILNKVSRFFRVIFGANETSPRGLQERNDSYFLLLVLQSRALRMEHQLSIGNAVGWKRESKEQIVEFMDRAADMLDQDSEGIHDLSLNKLRQEVQKRLEGQVLDRLVLASIVDEKFGHSVEDEFDEGRIDEYKNILIREYEDICAKSQEWEANEQKIERRIASRGEFYKRKKAGIERLLDYYDWWPENKYTERKGAVDVADDQEDEFGFCSSKSSPDVTPHIRYNHVKNLVRSYYARQNHSLQNNQFSIMSMKSTIPNAGRGVFITGYAPAGTLLAFFPGKIWPKDHLMSASLQTEKNLSENDPRHQLSMRYDDILVDSRRSPYTVYDNMWALAHVVNHPPPPRVDSTDDNYSGAAIKQLRHGPNCVTVPINFTKSMVDKHPGKEIDYYIPNEYEVQPKAWAKNAFDSDDVIMNGMGLIALRDVHDEELFYDYRLSPDKSGTSAYPEWYHVWNEDALNNRWSSEER